MTFTRRLLAVVLASLLAGGCVSIGVRSAEGEADAALTVSIYESSSDARAGTLAAFPVYTELVALGPQGERTVARSLAPRWSLDALPPGRYRLDVTKRIDERGDVVPLSNPGRKKLRLREDERVVADVVLSKVPVVWTVLGALTAVALVVLSIHLAKEGKLPVPRHLPPPPPIAVAVALDFAAARAEPRGPEPAAVDVFPAPGSVVAARRVAVSFLLAVPLDPSSVEPGAVSALGTKSGEITGAVSYRAREQILRFAPERDFAPGEHVTVTLDLSRVASADGRHGAGRTSTDFEVPAR